VALETSYSLKMTVFWGVLSCRLVKIGRCFRGAASLIRLQWCNIPEDSHLNTRRRENLKSHQETAIDSNSCVLTAETCVSPKLQVP
jgi:hypothetical protein